MFQATKKTIGFTVVAIDFSESRLQLLTRKKAFMRIRDMLLKKGYHFVNAIESVVRRSRELVEWGSKLNSQVFWILNLDSIVCVFALKSSWKTFRTHSEDGCRLSLRVSLLSTWGFGTLFNCRSVSAEEIIIKRLTVATCSYQRKMLFSKRLPMKITAHFPPLSTRWKGVFGTPSKIYQAAVKLRMTFVYTLRNESDPFSKLLWAHRIKKVVCSRVS